MIQKKEHDKTKEKQGHEVQIGNVQENNNNNDSEDDLGSWKENRRKD